MAWLGMNDGKLGLSKRSVITEPIPFLTISHQSLETPYPQWNISDSVGHSFFIIIISSLYFQHLNGDY